MLLDGDDASGLSRRGHDKIPVKRLDRCHVDDLAAHTLVGKRLGRLERGGNLKPACDHGDVRALALDDAPAKLEVVVILVNDGHGQAAKTHVHRALCLVCRANGGLGLDVIGRDDDRHAGDGPHEGEILVALVGGAVLAHRHARVRGPDDHVQMGVADGVSHLLEGATGGEHGKGAREHPVPRGRDAGSDAHEVLLRYADVDEAVGIGRLELARLGRGGEVGVEHHEVVVGGAQLHERLAIALAGSDLAYVCHSVHASFASSAMACSYCSSPGALPCHPT